MWGRGIKVEKCPCGAELLRWRDAHVGKVKVGDAYVGHGQ